MRSEGKVAWIPGAASGVEAERAGCDAPLNAGGAHLRCAVALVQKRAAGGRVADAIQRQALMMGELCE